MDMTFEEYAEFISAMLMQSMDDEDYFNFMLQNNLESKL